jgi:DNA-binding MarR family transcriptional regulator
MLSPLASCYRDVHALINKANVTTGQHGLSLTNFLVLDTLVTNDKAAGTPPTPSEVADMLRLVRPHGHVSARQLEQLGLIKDFKAPEAGTGGKWLVKL